MHYISDHFYPYTLTNKVKQIEQSRQLKSDEIKFVTKNFNKIIFNGSSILRSTFLSNNCYIGKHCIIGSDVDI